MKNQQRLLPIFYAIFRKILQIGYLITRISNANYDVKTLKTSL